MARCSVDRHDRHIGPLRPRGPRPIIRSVDAGAIDAGMDRVKRLGPDNARQLLAILELPDNARWEVAADLFQKPSGVALGELIADIEQDLTGKTRQRLIEGLHAALD